jgi:hypothetical protein
MLALGIFSLTGIPHLRSKQPELVSASVAQVQKGYRSGRLLGSNVVNDQNEKIGMITELVLGQDYALFAVLEIGSLLGLDTHLVAVPIQDTGRRVMLPGGTRKALRNFPEFRFPG